MSLYRPDCFHGDGQTRDFFEGWYFKFFDADGSRVIAVVPGIFHSKGESPEHSHSFIFVNVNGTEQHYFRFPLDDFNVPDANQFGVDLGGKNRFGPRGFSIDLEPRDGDDATIRLKGELRFSGNVEWPVTWASPGVMGPGKTIRISFQTQ